MVFFAFYDILCYNMEHLFVKRGDIYMYNYVMSLYNDKGIKKDYVMDNYVNGGAYGDVYKIDDDTCIKIISSCFYLSDAAIKVIRQLKLKRFYEIYDLLYDSSKHFVGYTMKYYPSEDIEIIKMPTSYTLDNLYELYQSFERLSDNYILTSDCYHENVIINSTGLTIIDTDFFQQCDDDVRIKNYDNLLYLFRSLYYKELRKLDFPTTDREYILDYLFNQNDDFKSVEKKLVKYKYPIDYINDCYRGKC